jgi:hypothetical protein
MRGAIRVALCLLSRMVATSRRCGEWNSVSSTRFSGDFGGVHGAAAAAAAVVVAGAVGVVAAAVVQCANLEAEWTSAEECSVRQASLGDVWKYRLALRCCLPHCDAMSRKSDARGE